MAQLCHAFHAPSPLWAFNDKEFGSITQSGPRAVCKAVDNSPTWNVETSVGNYCPQGTQCDCGASNDLFKWESTKDVRKVGGHLFVKDGIASGPSLRKQYRNGFLLSTTIASVKAGSLVGGLAAVVHAPMFLIG